MARRKLSNRFSKLMGQDISSHYSSNEVYRYAFNGRVRFNTKGDLVLQESKGIDGEWGAFSNFKGTRKIASLCPGYSFIGDADMEDYLLLFSCNGVNSEIGMISIDDKYNTVGYQTLFNDKFDPNKELLRFDKDYFIQTSVVKENNNIIRCYWRGDKNELRVLNISNLFDDKGVAYHKKQCGDNIYPNWMSVHSMNRSPSVRFSKLKYVQTIEGAAPRLGMPVAGNLKSGAYKYTYRYKTKDGYTTQWYPIGKELIVNADYYVDPITGKALENHHKYRMYETGISTQKSIKINLESLDIRFYEVEFAYIYYKTKEIAHEFNIFHKYKIERNLNSKNSYTVVHSSHSGEAISFTELNKTEDYVKSAKTGAIHNNKMFEGNILLQKPPIVDFSKATIEPIFKQMVCDEKGTVFFNSESDVITNTTPMLHKVSTRDFIDENGKDVLTQYDSIGEFKNYKGTRWTNLFTSYWRGETYRFAVVLGNIKGQPFFAQHIKDFTFPTQWNDIDGKGIDARLSTIDGQVRIMGANISNIKIPHDVLFDENGDLQIGYMMIVRASCVHRIVSQGLMMNAVFLPKCTVDNVDGGIPVEKIIRSKPYINNDFDSGTNGKVPDGHHYSTILYPLIPGSPVPGSNAGYCDGDQAPYSNAPYVFTFHSPDFKVDRKVPDLKPTDYLELTSTVFSSMKEAIHLKGHQLHLYTKAYSTDYTEKRIKYTSSVNKSRIRYSNLISPDITTNEIHLEDFDTYDLKREFHAYTEIFIDTNNNDSRFKSLLSPGSAVLVCKDWDAIDVTKPNNGLVYHLVNYCKQTDAYFTKEGDTSLSNENYFSTNHFQEITLEVLSKLPVVVENGKRYYVFNGVEVWGGDCFPHLFDSVINYPLYSSGCDGPEGTEFTKGHYDLAYSIICPIESHYNMMMRYGRTFAEVSTQPETAGCDNVLAHTLKGIMPQQPEDWNVNDVLQMEETIKLYPGLVSDVKLEYDIPNRWIYSNLKTYSERIDNYRVFLPLNYYDLDGSCGEITGCASVFDYLFSFQERGYGALQINYKAAISSQSGVEVILGTGKDLSGIDYVSKKIGTQHRDSIISTGNQVFWVDARMATINRHSQAGNDSITKAYGLHDFILYESIKYENKDNRTTRIVSSYDSVNENVFFTFRNGKDGITITFNTDLTGFHYKSTYAPYFYSRFKKYLLSESSRNNADLLLHNSGQYGELDGVLEDTIISFNCNEASDITKVFDVINLNCNVESYDLVYKIELSTQNQSHVLLLGKDFRTRYRHDSLTIPLYELDSDIRERLRSHILSVTIYIKNDGKRMFNLHSSNILIRDDFKK